MGMGVGGVGTARAVQTAAPAGPLTLRCSDCGQLFPTREARVAHQLLSSAPYKLSWPETCVPVWPEEPSANGAAGASAAPSGVATDGSAFATAPKHGVRMLRSMLEVQMAMPAILAEPLTAIDLEGDLAPSPTCCIDLLQVHLPTTDAVLLLHMASLPRQPLAALLRPWLESESHPKVLCDVRSDAEALQHLYAIRLQGVIDVQLSHAAATGELAKLRASASAGESVSPSDFAFPTGLSKLTSIYCGREVADPISALKAQFGALFDAGHSPFHALPLTAAAASYAAADVWHIWLVHEALWSKLQLAGLAMAVLTASEQRTGEFRDVPGGRERWDAAVAKVRGARAAAGRAGAASKADSPAGKGSRERGTRNQNKGRGAAEGGPGEGGMAAAPAALVGAAGRNGAVAAASGAASAADVASVPAAQPAAAKKRVVSGPACECCNVRFSGDKQLEEHCGGKRHALAAAVARRSTPPALSVECRQATLDEAGVRASFNEYGAIASVSIDGVKPGARPSKEGGPWFATVLYQDAPAAARALGQRYISVNGKRVYVETGDRIAE